MITIDQESTKRSLHPLNLDNMSERYITDNGLYVFTSPFFWTLEKNYFYLLANSKKVPLQQKYRCRPDYLSKDEYDTVILAPVLMYVNSCFTREDFIMDNVMVPTITAIIDVANDKYPLVNPSEMTHVDW